MAAKILRHTVFLLLLLILVTSAQAIDIATAANSAKVQLHDNFKMLKQVLSMENLTQIEEFKEKYKKEREAKQQNILSNPFEISSSASDVTKSTIISTMKEESSTVKAEPMTITEVAIVPEVSPGKSIFLPSELVSSTFSSLEYSLQNTPKLQESSLMSKKEIRVTRTVTQIITATKPFETLATSQSEHNGPSSADYKRIESLIHQLLERADFPQTAEGSKKIVDDQNNSRERIVEFETKPVDSKEKKHSSSETNISTNSKSTNIQTTLSHTTGPIPSTSKSSTRVTQASSSQLNSPIVSQISYSATLARQPLQPDPAKVKDILSSKNPAYEISITPQFREHSREPSDNIRITPYSKPKINWLEVAAKIGQTLLEVLETESSQQPVSPADDDISQNDDPEETALQEIYNELQEFLDQLEGQEVVGSGQENYKDNTAPSNPVEETYSSSESPDTFTDTLKIEPKSVNSPFSTFSSPSHITNSYRKQQGSPYNFDWDAPSHHKHRSNKTHHHSIPANSQACRLSLRTLGVATILLIAWVQYS